MAWKGLHVSKACRLRLRRGQVLLEQGREEVVSAPLEDLAFMVLDAPHAELTAPLLGACAEAGCLVMTTDARHMPNGVLLSFHGHHRQAEVLHLQLGLSAPRRKRIWQAIVRGKIENQAACLKRFQGGIPAVRILRKLAGTVKSGDPANVEGQAARRYWPGLVPGFKRDTDGRDRLNAMLNYGYAVLRGLVARQTSASGFVPALGLHHRAMHNAFNLADDLMEPWRPLVDDLALRRMESNPGLDELDRDDRTHMLSLASLEVKFADEVHSMLPAMRRYVETIRGCMGSKSAPAPIMPGFVPDDGPEDA